MTIYVPEWLAQAGPYLLVVLGVFAYPLVGAAISGILTRLTTTPGADRDGYHKSPIAAFVCCFWPIVLPFLFCYPVYRLVVGGPPAGEKKA